MKNNIPDTIIIQGLSKNYGRSTGISDLTLSIKQGEIFGFLGPNGAGKTTTIRLLLGLIKPTSGKIWLLGKERKDFQKDFQNNIGYLPGDLGLYKDMSGNSYLQHFMTMRKGKHTSQCKTKLDNLKSRFNIAFDRRLSDYSKGMKQVIGIIQTFMHNPEIVILDEPTSGLDPIMQERFYDLLLEEKNAGKTIFMSSHILSEVEKICDRIGIVRNGKLIKVEDIGSYHSNILKKVTIFPHATPAGLSDILNTIPGLKNITIKNEGIEFYYSGDMQQLIKRIADIKIKDLLCESPTLEDVFYEYYKD